MSLLYICRPIDVIDDYWLWCLCSSHPSIFWLVDLICARCRRAGCVCKGSPSQRERRDRRLFGIVLLIIAGLLSSFQFESEPSGSSNIGSFLGSEASQVSQIGFA